MDEARSLQYSINVTADTSQAESNIRNLTSSLGEAQSGQHRITIDADTRQAENGIRRVTSDLGDVRSEATSVGSAFRKSFLEGIDSGSSFASSLKQGVGGALSHVKGEVSNLKDTVTSAASSIKEGFSHPITTIKDGLGNAVQSVKDKFISMARGADDAADSADDLGDSSEEAARDVRDAGDAADSSGGKFEKFGSILKGVGVALLATTTAVAGFAAASVNVGMEFDSSMSQVAATMGYSVEELHTAGSEAAETYSELRSFAMEMGATTAFSAKQASDALNYMALAGYDAETSMAMLPNVLNLAAAGGIELAQASDMVTDAQSALGLSLDQTSILVDQMAQTASKSNTSVAQLGEAILTIGGTAKNLAGGTTELNTMLGVLADNGIKGAEGGTALRNVILSLSAPTDQAAKALADLGLEVFDAEGNMRPLNETFGDLQGILGTMSQQEQTEVLNTIFNKVDLKSVNALLGTSADRFGELSGAIGDASGAAQDMANVQLDNLAGDITLFKSALEGAQIVLSDQLSPTLREFVQFGSGAITELSTAFQEGGLSGAMGALGGVLSDALEMIVGMLPSFINAGMQLLGALGKGILSNIPAIIDAAAQIVVTLAEGITASMSDLDGTGSETLNQIVTSISDNLPIIITAAGQIILALASGIGSNLPEIVPSVVETMLTVVSSIIDNLPLVLEAGMQIISGLAEGILNAIPILVEQLPQIILSFIGFLTENMPTILEQGSQILLSLGMGIINAIPQLVAQLPSIITAFVGFVTENLPLIVETGINLLVQLGLGIIQAIPQLVAQLPQIISAIVGGLAELPGMMVEIGGNIVKGLWEGIKGLASWIWDKVSGWASDLWDGICGFFGIHSPSTKFAWAGEMMIDGLAGSIDKNGGEAVDAVTNMAKDIGDAIPTNLEGPEIGAPSMGEAIIPDVSYAVNPIIGDVNTPNVSDVTYGVNPIITDAKISNPAGDRLYDTNPVVSDFNPPDTSAENTYAGEAPGNDAPQPEPSEGGGAPVFAPQISIVVQGEASEENVENLRSSLYDTVRELFQEFREEELERQTLKNQYAY